MENNLIGEAIRINALEPAERSSAILNLILDTVRLVAETARLTDELMEKLEGMKYGPFQQQECCFCLSPLASSPRCYLPCQHLFHTNCMNIYRSNKCPLCRSVSIL